MATEPKLKVNIGADTSQFEKGIRQTKSDLKSFGQVSDDVFGKLGKVIGVDTDQVDKMAAALRGMGVKLGEAGKEGENSFGKIAKAATAAGASIAAIGIAGAIAGFKALTAEAENFKNTVAGANIELQTQAYVQTYTQVMHDFVSDTGKSVAEVESKWKKFWGTLGSNVKSYFASGAFGEAMNPWSNKTTGTEQYAALRNQAEESAKTAAAYAKDLFDIDRQRSDNLVKIAELEKTIAANQRIMRSETATQAEKQAAYAAAEQAINDKYALQVPLLKERARILTDTNKLAGSTVEQVDAANQAQADAIRLEGQQEDELRSLERMARGITAQTRANNAALEQHLAILKQIADIRALNLGVSGNMPTAGAVSQLPVSLAPRETPEAFQELLSAHFGDTLHISVGVDLDKQRFMDVSRELELVIGQMANNLGEIIGGLIGDLATGGDAWGNFANAAMSAFGDMAITVGKIAIATGLATESIKAALTKLGGFGAIAAGVALVALGTAVKAGLSNVAGGNYSAGGAIASSSYATGGDYETRDLNIHVTGQLQADGDSLVAVLNNTNNRNGYTT